MLPFTSEVWDTACALRVLLVTGTPPEHPGVKRAVDYLLRQQCQVPAPADFQNPRAGAPPTGGWSYGEDNPSCPDCDTTGAVLWALRSRPPGSAPGRDPALSRAIDQGQSWLLGMQNPDGGWASFSQGHPSKRPGPMEARPMLGRASLLDALHMVTELPLGFSNPSCEELTGRVLSGLGAGGMTTGEGGVSPADRAVAFILLQRNEDGVFWGRWMVNYLAATACVLSGLQGIGLDMTSDPVQRAVRWMAARQNPDGGFGETVDSYPHPERAGAGPSTPGLTGLVLTALLDAGEMPGSATGSIARGVRYLLEAQREDGGWEDACCSKVVQPPTVYYQDPLFPIYAPLLALWQVAQRT